MLLTVFVATRSRTGHRAGDRRLPPELRAEPLHQREWFWPAVFLALWVCGPLLVWAVAVFG